MAARWQGGRKTRWIRFFLFLLEREMNHPEWLIEGFCVQVCAGVFRNWKWAMSRSGGGRRSDPSTALRLMANESAAETNLNVKDERLMMVFTWTIGEKHKTLTIRRMLSAPEFRPFFALATANEFHSSAWKVSSRPICIIKYAKVGVPYMEMRWLGG